MDIAFTFFVALLVFILVFLMTLKIASSYFPVTWSDSNSLAEDVYIPDPTTIHIEVRRLFKKTP